MPKIAVNIVTYNSANVIGPCLRALQAQDADFDVCIVDNASSDSTVEQLATGGWHIIKNPANLGYAAAHNLALAQTDSEYVLTLNPDVLLQPGYLSAMARALDSHPEAGSAAGCLLRVDQLDDTPQAIDGIGLFMRRNRRQGLLLENAPLADVPAEPHAIFGPDGAAAFYRRAMLDDIAVSGEVFDEDFFMHKEDVDLCWRAQLAGWSSLVVPQARAHHIRTFRPGRREKVDPALRRDAVRNRYLMMMKDEIPALFWRDILWITLYDIAILGYLLLREPSSLTALAEAWKLRKSMLKKRHIIQSKRKATRENMAAWFSARP
jgi:GT2 family glycosyltransferase